MIEAKNKASESIAEKWACLKEGSLNKKIIRAFIYIIDNCLGCEKTARRISEQLTEISKEMIPQISLEIIKDLKGNDYFIPDEEIKKRIWEIELLSIVSNKPKEVGKYLFK
ncbi:MAG: hypothetical protein EOM84_01220 [Sphingobacteriia bacterium]|nr:hypothetical protein [Sphingobacteriia bacterium]